MEEDDFQELQKTWDDLGKEDPFGAILNPNWDDQKVDEFFKTGEMEVKEVMEIVDSIEAEYQDVNIPRKLALDFGCGVGRLTQALAGYFSEVHGVDISASMISRANEYNSHGDRCRYHLNERDDLGLFPDGMFNFIYSNVTLMHIEPKYAGNYIRELLRVVEPGGLLIFQHLSEPKLDPNDSKNMKKVIKHLAKTTAPEAILHWIRKTRYENLRQKADKPIIEMYWMKRKRVEKLLNKSGVRTLRVLEDRTDWPYWVSCRYCVTK
jgi:ubiquinone/menaquinone biosynthesis C-methylase UbiE